MRPIGSRRRALCGRAISIVLAALSTVPAIAAAVTDVPDGEAIPAAACARIRPLDRTAARRLQTLAASSAAARDALALLCRRRDVRLTISSNAALLRRERSRGLSRFWIERGALIGRLQFDTGDSTVRQQERALAHELAHATELALIPPQDDTRALASALLTRLGRHAPWSRQMRIETPYAVALEEAIIRELGGRAAPGETARAQDRR